MSSRLLALALTSSVVACGAPAATPAGPAPGSPPPPVAVQAQPPVASASGTASAAPTAPEPEPIPLYLVADGFSQPVTFHALEGATIVTSEGFVGVLEGDAVVPRPQWLAAKGAPFDRDGIVIGGRFPSSAWMAVTRDESLLKWTVELYRLRGDAWVQARAPQNNGGIFTDIVPWVDGRVVGVTTVVSRDQVAFDLLDGPKLTLVDMVSDTRSTDRRCGCAKGCGCPVIASGPVVAGEKLSVLGRQHHYPSDANSIVLESFWRSDTVRGDRVFHGDGGHVDVVGAVLLAPNDVVCGANVTSKDGHAAALVRRAWLPPSSPVQAERAITTPVDRRLTSMAGALDGTLCVAGESARDAPGDSRAYCAASAGAWRPLAIPDPHVTIHAVRLGSGGDIWVSATVRAEDGRSPPHHRVYHGHATSSPLHADPGHSASELAEPFRPPPPGFADCEHSFVWLRDSRSLPTEWAAPLRAVVAGYRGVGNIRIVAASERGRSHIGAVVPSYEAGVELVAKMIRKLPGAQPRLLCHEPDVIRDLSDGTSP